MLIEKERKNIGHRPCDKRRKSLCSCDNLANLFTKSLPSRVFEKLVKKIGRRLLRDNCLEEGEK
jgi:hypothetical protein